MYLEFKCKSMKKYLTRKHSLYMLIELIVEIVYLFSTISTNKQIELK